MSLRVLIVNKFYYPRGGDCVCSINLERLLASHGHTTAVYSMSYPENIPTRWDKYFASEVDFGKGMTHKIAALKRTLGLGDINKSFNKILDDFKPDVVHLNNIHSYLSPKLAVIAKKRNIKVVWTLHDYKLICPSYLCLHAGHNCEDCFTSKANVLKKRCMKGSLVASAVAYIEALKWNRDVLEHNVDTFICPSRFMRSKMMQAGFSEDKLTVNCNFLDFSIAERLKEPQSAQRDDYYCFVGRLSHEKGLDVLLEAARQLPYKLKIAGDGPLMQESPAPNIEFLGRLNALQVSDLLSNARFSVIPSQCYDNNPLSVIESLSCGTPVVGANIGGIPELIDEGSTGHIFESGSVEGLKSAIISSFDKNWDNDQIREKSLARFSAETHYDILMNVYNKTI